MKGYDALVTVYLAAHDGDAHLLGRALASLEAQQLDPHLFDVVICYDGRPGPEAEQHIQEIKKQPFSFPLRLAENPEHTGYYTVPRNRAIVVGGDGGAARSPYVVNMDADNEFTPEHLIGLVKAIRKQSPDSGWPPFVYTRRVYVFDEGAANPKLPSGPSPLVVWNRDSVAGLLVSPMGNFVDTGDFIASRGMLYEVAERTGFVWNPDARRYGDWELVQRIARCGFHGRALDQLSHIYHWTGKNLQTTRWTDDVIAIPEALYNELVRRGLRKKDEDASSEEAS